MSGDCTIALKPGQQERNCLKKKKNLERTVMYLESEHSQHSVERPTPPATLLRLGPGCRHRRKAIVLDIRELPVQPNAVVPAAELGRGDAQPASQQ